MSTPFVRRDFWERNVGSSAGCFRTPLRSVRRSCRSNRQSVSVVRRRTGEGRGYRGQGLRLVQYWFSFYTTKRQDRPLYEHTRLPSVSFPWWCRYLTWRTLFTSPSLNWSNRHLSFLFLVPSVSIWVRRPSNASGHGSFLCCQPSPRGPDLGGTRP